MWRWLSDDGWEYYSIINSLYMEQAWQSKSETITLDIGGIPFEINFTNMKQTSRYSGRSRKISREPTNGIWFWELDNGIFHPYQPYISNQIEHLFIHSIWSTSNGPTDIATIDNEKKSSDDLINIAATNILSSSLSPSYNGSQENLQAENNYLDENKFIDDEELRIGQYSIYPNSGIQVNRQTGRIRNVRRRQLQYSQMDKKWSCNEMDFTTLPSEQVINEELLSNIITVGRINFEDNIYKEGQTESELSQLLSDEELNSISTTILPSGYTGEIGVKNSFLNDLENEMESCPICLDYLNYTLSSDDSNYDDIIMFNKCYHHFHLNCIKQLLKQKCTRNILRCPMCLTVLAYSKGLSPPGRMKYIIYKSGYIQLTGFEDYGVIEIEYIIPSGIQCHRHPVKGQQYMSTYKIAYIPLCYEGLLLFILLQRCFKNGHTFKIESMAYFSSIDRNETELSGFVCWNDITHKTSTCGGIESHGYPDTDYLTRLKLELKEKGIVETKEDIEFSKYLYDYFSSLK